jgi:hypothetical protein
MLAFSAIHGELDGVAVGAVEGLVAVQDDLDVVVAGRDVVEIADGVAKGGVVDGDGLARLELVEVEAEDHLGAGGEVDLHPGLGGGIGGKQEEDAAVDGLGAAFLGERHRERGDVCGSGGYEKRETKSQKQKGHVRTRERARTKEH